MICHRLFVLVNQNAHPVVVTQLRRRLRIYANKNSQPMLVDATLAVYIFCRGLMRYYYCYTVRKPWAGRSGPSAFNSAQFTRILNRLFCQQPIFSFLLCQVITRTKLFNNLYPPVQQLWFYPCLVFDSSSYLQEGKNRLSFSWYIIYWTLIWIWQNNRTWIWVWQKPQDLNLSVARTLLCTWIGLNSELWRGSYSAPPLKRRV